MSSDTQRPLRSCWISSECNFVKMRQDQLPSSHLHFTPVQRHFRNSRGVCSLIYAQSLAGKLLSSLNNAMFHTRTTDNVLQIYFQIYDHTWLWIEEYKGSLEGFVWISSASHHPDCAEGLHGLWSWKTRDPGDRKRDGANVMSYWKTHEKAGERRGQKKWHCYIAWIGREGCSNEACHRPEQ